MSIETCIAHVTSITKYEEYTIDKLRTSFVKMLDYYKDKEILAAEIGVWEGVNAKYMLLFCDKLKLVLVDDWSNVVVYTGGPIQDLGYREGLKNSTKINLINYPDRVYFANKNSAEAVLDFPDNTFDYVYIDGDHEYQAVQLDLNLWWPKVKTGGMLAGHDVVDEGVAKALDEFIKEQNIPEDKWGKENIPPQGEIQGRSDFWIYK
jgi:hypothetical protein